MVTAGRLFLRRMIETAKTVRRLNHWIHLEADFRSDLDWWSLFLGYWNGCSMMQTHCQDQAADVVIVTDATAQSRYLRFCQAIGKPPLPATEGVLVLFAAHMAQSVCHATMRAYLSAVRHLHVSRGYGDPLKNTLQLDLVLKGAKRKKPSGTDKRLPVTPVILQSILTVVKRDPSQYTNIMMWAACCLGYFAFLRSGEFTTTGTFNPELHLSVEDVAVDSHENPTVCSIHLKQSKTDQEKRGITLYVGRTTKQICPVTAMLSYLVVRSVRAQTRALFVQEDGTPRHS